MLRRVYTSKQTVTSIINHSSASIVSRSYSKSLDLEAETLRIQVETRKLKELKEQQLKQKQQLRDDKAKQKKVEDAKKLKAKILTKQSEQRIKKAKALELERFRKRKQREALREIEKKQKKKLEDLRQKSTAEKKKSARKSDPDLPSRPIFGLFWYNAEHFKSVRAELVAQNKPSSAPDVLKVVAERYKNLSEDQKAKYLKLESGERERYQRERAAYEKKKKAQIPARNTVLRPYMRFCIEVRPEVTKSNPTLKPTQVVQKIGEMWRELGEEKKQQYKQAYDRDVAAVAENKQQE